MSSIARPRTNAGGGDALCIQLDRLPQEVFEDLMNLILNNSNVDACSMIQAINWGGAGVTHMDLSRDDTWLEMVLRIFNNNVPYGRCVTAADRLQLEQKLNRMPDEIRLQVNWQERFNVLCNTLRSYSCL